MYLVFLTSFPFFALVVLVSLCIAKSKWFITDTGLGNPYREVAQVVGFTRRHKVPIQCSAFTYWEDDIPTGLDLGKSKYGGPFTTEQVENVKAFFSIVYILLSLSPFFTADIAASAFLPILKHHMDNRDPIPFSFADTVYSFFFFFYKWWNFAPCVHCNLDSHLSEDYLSFFSKIFSQYFEANRNWSLSDHCESSLLTAYEKK